MVLLVFCGTVLGNFVLGFIEKQVARYLVFSILGGIIGGWIFLQISRKMF